MLGPPLKPLHSDADLVKSKLEYFEKLSSDDLKASLQIGQQHSLKARQDGTILDGHHRIAILRSRGVEVDALPREIIVKDEPSGSLS
jgi:ParB-like chromosome segregation protein Spo0J